MSRSFRTTILLLLIALAGLCGYFAGWHIRGEDAVQLLPKQKASAEDAGLLQQRIIKELEGRYYKKVDAGKLKEAGVKGTLKVLNDPYTVYLTPKEVKDLKETQSGEYSGIGASLEKREHDVLITTVFAGSPAERAGLKSGDAILTVDGKSTSGAAIDASVSRIKGSPGTSVKLGVRRKDAKRVEEITVVRASIEVPETKTRLETVRGKKIGYIHLLEFGGHASRDVRRDVTALQKKGAQAIVLDLRFNGGGLLVEAVAVTSIFEQGVVTSTQGLHSPREVLKTSGSVVTKQPLVVLVNEYSASSSEIVTGALKDHHRAKIVGTKTFGKGLVQSVIPLKGGGALKLTTASYRTPAGLDINKKGIVPDIVVRDNPKTKGDEQLKAALSYLVTQL